MHQTINPILPTTLTIFAQVAKYLPIAIDPAALQPELFNQPGELLIGNGTIRARLVKPRVITAGVDIKQVTQRPYRPSRTLGPDKGVPQSG